MSMKPTRRTFVKTGVSAAAGVAATLASSRAAGANERVRAGFIGVANRGGQLIEAGLENKNLEVVAVCDAYKPAMAKWAGALPGDVAQYDDFREMLERKDIDAVFIATPDHWHAIQMIAACKAGKDVYVEKPLTATIREGRRMVEVARETKRVVQVGTHRRSSALYADLHALVRGGELGKVTLAHAYRVSNMWPNGIGKKPVRDVPKGLDWDMWLGPRAYRPFRETIAPYKFRWWRDFSSQAGNWGVHYFDVMRWMLDEEAPVSVSAHGGNFAVDDDRTIPDTMHATFEFASGRLMIFGQYEASHHPMMPAEIDLRGTKGIAYATAKSFEIIPERPGQFQGKEPRSKPRTQSEEFSNHLLTAKHIGNFLDCMKSRKRPNADIEIGHRSTTFCHLANIALATKSRIEWDAKHERVKNNDAANALLHYEYRKPWKLG